MAAKSSDEEKSIPEAEAALDSAIQDTEQAE